MVWITVPDDHVTFDDSYQGGAPAGVWSYSAGLFTADGWVATGIGPSNPGTNGFNILLPAGYTYTGNTRLTILSIVNGGVYTGHLFTETFLNPPAMALTTYLDNIGSIAAGENKFCPAGEDNGSPGLNLTFNLEFEGAAVASDFWTGFVGFAEEIV